MQELKVYVSAASAVGVVRDYANARSSALPALVRGVEACLKLRLFETADGNSPYPIDQLFNISAWAFVMDKDYNDQTASVLKADNASITVQSVTDTILDSEYTYTEVSIPLPNTNTEELNEWLGTAQSKSGLSAELVGYNSEGKAVFVLQLENFTVRNRLTSAGDPTELPPDYWTEAQVRAFVTSYIDSAIDSKIQDMIINGEW